MRHFFVVRLLALAILSTLLCGNTHAELDTESIDQAVVIIHTFDIYGRRLGHGSGFVFATDSILTNYHVVAGAYYVEVETRMGERHQVGHLSLQDLKETLENAIKGTYPALDWVLLHVKNLGLPALKLADASSLKLRETVFAVGHPLGLWYTHSRGYINRLPDNLTGGLILHQAPISKGNSGGPLLNTRDEVVGINVSKVIDGENLNLAIPLNYVIEAIRDSALVTYSLKEMVKNESQHKLLSK